MIPSTLGLSRHESEHIGIKPEKNDRQKTTMMKQILVQKSFVHELPHLGSSSYKISYDSII